MHQFYFNDCIPVLNNQVSFTEYLCLTIIEFNKLLKKDIDVVRAIITHTPPAESYYGNTYNLKEAIENISDRQRRDLAYSLFVRYPIGLHFDDTDDTFISEQYKCTIGSDEFNAINLAIVAKSEGFLFTVGINEFVSINPIYVTINNSEQILTLPNLFGNVHNTEEIEAVIRYKNAAQLNSFNQLIASMGECRFSLQFKKAFNALSLDLQKTIYVHFEYARNRKMHTPYYPDDKIIKDITLAKSKCTVYELRIMSPVGLRIYFSVLGEKVFLGSIGFKNNNQQDQDIRQAHNILYRLILTS